MSFNEFNIQFFAVRLGPDTSPQLIPPLLRCAIDLEEDWGKGSGAIGATESPELEA